MTDAAASFRPTIFVNLPFLATHIAPTGIFAQTLDADPSRDLELSADRRLATSVRMVPAMR